MGASVDFAYAGWEKIASLFLDFQLSRHLLRASSKRARPTGFSFSFNELDTVRYPCQTRRQNTEPNTRGVRFEPRTQATRGTGRCLSV